MPPNVSRISRGFGGTSPADPGAATQPDAGGDIYLVQQGPTTMEMLILVAAVLVLGYFLAKALSKNQYNENDGEE